MRVLILAAHPDDECLGAGGTIARLSAEGHAVYIAILSQGIDSRYTESPISGDEAMQQELEKIKAKGQNVRNALKAGKHLGAKCVTVDPQPDQKFDTVPLLEIVQHIAHITDKVRPEVIYTHHGGDLNQDHRAVAHATLIATRPTAECSVKAVYTYEVPSSTEWAFGMESAFRPNVFVDISGEYLEKKIQAMKMYESERRAFPHPRSPEALRALATWRGAQAGVMAAEAFQLVRSVR